MVRRVFGCLLMLSVAAAHAQTQASSSTFAWGGKNELAPQTRATIQSIGQSVLGVRRGYVADPALIAAQAELYALRATVENAHKTNFASAAASIKLQNLQAPVTDAAPLNSVEHDKSSPALQGHLGRLHAHRAQLEAHAQDERGDESARSLARSAAKKLVQLEREIDEMQQANGEERAKRLAQLRERLMPQSLLSLTASDPEPHTPTISTIVEHRR